MSIPSNQSDERLWGSRRASVALLLTIAALSVCAATLVPAPVPPAAISLNSPWVFRAEVLLGAFFITYIVTAITITTIRNGRPPKKLGFGMIAFEGEAEKTFEVLNDSATVLDAAQRQLNRLDSHLECIHATVRSIAQALEAVSGQAGMQLSPTLRHTLDQQLARLERFDEGSGDIDFDAALATFRTSMDELQEMMREN
jgi:hypothetical protein